MTTINRKEYYPSAADFQQPEDWTPGTTSSVLGLPALQETKAFDGSLDYTGLTIDDAFNIDDISVQSTSSALLSLAADIAAIRLQPRLIPTALTLPTVGGLKCTANDSLSADKVWLSCGDTQEAATPTAVTALDAADTNVKALLADISDALGIPCGALWSISKTANNEVVSVAAGGYSDGHVIMDGRSTTVGYPVEGGTDVVWTALGKSQLMVLNADSTKDSTNKTLLCRLLIALGMPEALAVAEQAALSQSADAGLAEPTVSDGVITLSGESNPLVGKSRMLYKASNAVHPWISVDADGASMLVWQENKGDVFALIAGMAKKAMDGIVGVGLVGVGKNGGVIGWMVDWNTKYGISYPNLMALNGTSKIATLKEIYNLDKENYNMMQTSDGKIYVRVCHHFINNGSIMFANATAAGYTLNDANRYSILSKIADIGQLNNTFEFYLEQYQNVGDATPSVYIWSQTSNPSVSTSLSGFVNISNMDKGIAKYGSNTFMCYASGAWWGAIGAYSSYSGGIPGVKQMVVKGTQNLYLRVM